MMADQFVAPGAEDFADAVQAVVPTEPARPTPTHESAKAQAQLAAQRPATAEEIEPSRMKRMLAGAGHTMSELFSQQKQPSYGLESDPWAQAGALIPGAIGSAAVKAATIPQALYGALFGAAQPGDPLERAGSAVSGGATGGLGQILAGTTVRGANVLAGQRTPEGIAAEAARRQGLDLTTGQILKSPVLKKMEEVSIRAPGREQGEQVARLMTEPTGDPISNAVRNAYEAAQSRVTESATKLDDILAQNPKMPKVQMYNTTNILREIAQRSPDTVKNIRDPMIAKIVEELANTPAGRIPKGMSFRQLDELRRTLGPITAKIDVQSRSGASNVNTADANRWKQLYKAIMDDMESWGGKSVPAEALAAHKDMISTFKSQVLPLREHPIAGKVLGDGYARPEDLLRDLTAHRNKSVVGDLYGRLDQGGKNAFDALRLAERGSKEFVRGEQPSRWARPLTLTTAAGLGSTAPMWAPSAAGMLPWIAALGAAEQGAVHAANTRLGRAIASGSPVAARSPLGNAVIQAGLRTTLNPMGGLGALRQEEPQVAQ